MNQMPTDASQTQEGRPRISLGADHAGFRAKEAIKRHLESSGYNVEDFGTWSEDSVDYPDFAIRVAHSVIDGGNTTGILVCGTGIGMAIAANKVGGIRAAVAHDATTAQMSREHNDANVLCVGARVATETQIVEIVSSFLSAKFAGGRHERRVNKIIELDQERQELKHRA